MVEIAIVAINFTRSGSCTRNCTLSNIRIRVRWVSLLGLTRLTYLTNMVEIGRACFDALDALDPLDALDVLACRLTCRLVVG